MRETVLTVLLLTFGAAISAGQEACNNVPSAACMNKSTGGGFVQSSEEGASWGVVGGTGTAVKYYFKKRPHGWVQVGVTWEGAGIYPMPWCTISFDPTCSCSQYWCGEHIWDDVIPRPEMKVCPAIAANGPVTDYTSSHSEYQMDLKLLKTYWAEGMDGWSVLKEKRRGLTKWRNAMPKTVGGALAACTQCVNCKKAGSPSPGAAPSKGSPSSAAQGALLIGGR